MTIFDVFRQKVVSFNPRQGYDLRKNLNDSAAIAPLALILLLSLREEKIVDKAKPRVIVGRLPAVTGGGPAAPKMGEAGKATGPDQDSRVAKAKRFLRGARGLYRSRAFYFGKNK